MIAIVYRAITAVILTGAGGLIGYGLSGILAMFGWVYGDMPDIATIALGAYVAASAPYAWAVGRDWLVANTDDRERTPRYVPLRSTIWATLAVGPILGPIGMAIDFRRYRELVRQREAQFERIWQARASTHEDGQRLLRGHGPMPMRPEDHN